ncbi:MAG: hypothetical protein V8S89_00055 [Oscillospiraceae bacterium]
MKEKSLYQKRAPRRRPYGVVLRGLMYGSAVITCGGAGWDSHPIFLARPGAYQLEAPFNPEQLFERQHRHPA